MTKTVINVDGMACEHCVNAITKAVGAVAGVNSVAVDLGAKTVTVDHDLALAPVEKLKEEIEDQGYDVVE